MDRKGDAIKIVGFLIVGVLALALFLIAFGAGEIQGIVSDGPTFEEKLEQQVASRTAPHLLTSVLAAEGATAPIADEAAEALYCKHPQRSCTNTAPPEQVKTTLTARIESQLNAVNAQTTEWYIEVATDTTTINTSSGTLHTMDSKQAMRSELHELSTVTTPLILPDGTNSTITFISTLGSQGAQVSIG